MIAVLIFGIYHIEQRVQDLRAELTGINQNIKSSKERIHVLNAEWSYLTSPSRLSRLTQEQLPLNYVAAAQVKDVAEIPLRPVMVGSVQ